MSTIIEHAPTGHRYILLGAGYGAWAAARGSNRSRNIRSVIPVGKSGENHMLAAADAQGEILWITPEEARVVSVDGQDPADVLAAYEAAHPQQQPDQDADAA